jgi:hypothetical protein
MTGGVGATRQGRLDAARTGDCCGRAAAAARDEGNWAQRGEAITGAVNGGGPTRSEQQRERAASQSEQGTTTSRDTRGIGRDCGGRTAGAAATATMGVSAPATTTRVMASASVRVGGGQERQRQRGRRWGWGESESESDGDGEGSGGGLGAMGEGSRTWTAIGDDTATEDKGRDNSRRPAANDTRLDDQQQSTTNSNRRPTAIDERHRRSPLLRAQEKGGGLWVVGCGGVASVLV